MIGHAHGAVISKRSMVALILLGLTVSLAGCGILGGASISNVEIGVAGDQTPVLSFEYSVSDYSTALIEGPNGQVVNEERLEPDASVALMDLRTVAPGEYTLAIQSGGDTVAKKTMEFEGAKPVLADVQPSWSGNRIESVSTTIENEGDLPLKVASATFFARGESFGNDPMYEWIPAGGNETITFTPSFGGTIEITEAGDVDGDAQIRTSAGTLEGTFERTFEGPKLEIESTSPKWEGNRLESVDVLVKNNGDLPVEANASVVRNGEKMAWSSDKDIPPGDSENLEVVSLAYIFKTSSSGNITAEIIVDSPEGFKSKTITHYVEPSNLSIESMESNWEGADLNSVTISLSNSGEVGREVNAILTVDGESVQTWDPRIPASSTKEYVFETLYGVDPLYTADSGGEKVVTLTIQGESGTSSASDSRNFSGLEASISEVSTSFYSNFDSNTSDLSTVRFRVRNDGDIPLQYDEVKISIAGSSRSDEVYATGGLEPGSSSSEWVSLSDGITVSQGEHELKIELVHQGQTVKTTTQTVSTDS